MIEIIQKSYYAIIPANVRYDKNLTPNAKLLYGEITALCNEKGFCWAENKYFSELYGVSKTSISKWIKALIDGGYIQSQIIYKEGTKEIDKRYITIVNNPIEQKLNTPTTFVVDPIEQKLKDNITVNNTNNITSNNTKEKKESKSAKRNSFDEILATYTDDFETLDLLKEWLKVRKAKRAAMTDRAIQMNISKLDNLANASGMTVKEYLSEVICRGWAAFYEIKQYNSSASEKKASTSGGNVFLELAKEQGIY